MNKLNFMLASVDVTRVSREADLHVSPMSIAQDEKASWKMNKPESTSIIKSRTVTHGRTPA